MLFMRHYGPEAATNRHKAMGTGLDMGHRLGSNGSGNGWERLRVTIPLAEQLRYAQARDAPNCHYRVVDDETGVVLLSN